MKTVLTLLYSGTIWYKGLKEQTHEDFPVLGQNMLKSFEALIINKMLQSVKL